MREVAVNPFVLSLRTAIGDERDDWLDLLLATHVVPTFDTDRLTVLRHYPASQAALARLCPSDPQLADRFEVFHGPVELANGYVELTDGNEQRRRMDLPPCAGVAMGLERLQMIHDRTDDIRDVITFPFQEQA